MEPLLLAYSLSGAAGLRSSLVVLVVAVSTHFGFLHPNPDLAWIGSWGLIAFASVTTVGEFLGDKIPLLDHALHGLHFILAPVAGAIAAASGYNGEPAVDVVLGVLGAGNALVVHTARTGVRAASSAATLGTGNLFISFAEDVATVFYMVIAVLAPWLTALGLILVTYWLVKKMSRLRLSRQASARAGV